jgi:hypothetical protein
MQNLKIIETPGPKRVAANSATGGAQKNRKPFGFLLSKFVRRGKMKGGGDKEVRELAFSHGFHRHGVGGGHMHQRHSAGE